MSSFYPLILFIVLLLAGCKKQTFDQRILQEVDIYNRREGGKMLNDGVTRRDSLHYDTSTRTLSYCHTMVGEGDNKDLINQSNMQTFRNSLLEELKNDLRMRPYLESELNIRYIYYSQSTGEILVENVFTPDDYR